MKNARVAAIPIVIVLMFTGLYLAYLSQDDDSLTRAKESGLIIGYAVEPPFALVKPGGTVGGEGPETAARLAAILGVTKVSFRQTNFGNLIEELRSGKIDVIAAGMFITPDRAKLVSFSHPSLHVAQGLLVAQGNPLGLHSYEDLKKSPNATVAALTGSVEERLLQQLGLPAQRLHQVPDALTGRVAVESGQADALALSALTTRNMAQSNQLGRTEVAVPFTQPAPIPGSGSGYRLGYAAFAFRTEDKALLNAWNLALLAFRDGPEHLAIMNEYGLTGDDLPGNATTEAILKP